MLKSTISMFVVFSTFANITPATVLDQNETLTTTHVRKKTKELCDETITSFLSNPPLLKKLEHIVKNIGLESINVAQIFSMTRIYEGQTKPYLSYHEASLIASAHRLGLTNTITVMHKFQRNHWSQDQNRDPTSVREINVNLDHPF